MNNLQLECLERDIIRDVKKQVSNLGPIEIGESVERVMNQSESRLRAFRYCLSPASLDDRYS